MQTTAPLVSFLFCFYYLLSVLDQSACTNQISVQLPGPHVEGEVRTLIIYINTYARSIFGLQIFSYKFIYFFFFLGGGGGQKSVFFGGYEEIVK